MPVIRSQQLETFDELALTRFRESAAEHARAAFPKHMRYLDDEGLRERVDESIERAESYGIRKSGGILLILDLAFLLGNGYASDPQLPWAAEILGDDDLPEAVKLDRLHRAGMGYLDEVSGSNNEHIDAAQVRLRAESLDDLAGQDGADLEVAIARKMHKVFPEKFNYLGRDGVVALVQAGRAGASSYGITSGRGVAVYVGLMYMLGSGFDSDSLYNWAHDILRDTELAEAEKVSRLHSGSMDFLGEWCG